MFLIKRVIARWSCPKANSVKLNVDIACDKNKVRTGFGAIIRNDKGSFLIDAIEVFPSHLSVFASEA